MDAVGGRDLAKLALTTLKLLLLLFLAYDPSSLMVGIILSNLVLAFGHIIFQISKTLS